MYTIEGLRWRRGFKVVAEPGVDLDNATRLDSQSPNMGAKLRGEAREVVHCVCALIWRCVLRVGE